MSLLLTISACAPEESAAPAPMPERIRVIFDTDANNEVDDQHALAYLLFNGEVFDVEAVTVNATTNGGDIHEQALEAERVVRLCGLYPAMPVLKGANGSFEDIQGTLDAVDYDGHEAVDFMIQRAMAPSDKPLVLLPVGKLTNIALALKKAPEIAGRVRIVWLGSNYPEPGEYNQDNDEAALNFILDADVPFEIALVRYGKPSGTDAVRVTFDDIVTHMPGKGPHIDEPVTGRHGVAFTNFGDYSVNLFEHIEYHGDPPSRALFDMAAVAIVKNPTWATPVVIPRPILIDGVWEDRPENPLQMTIWEEFDRAAILADFWQTMDTPVLVAAP